MLNPELNLAPFGCWTPRDKAAQRRLALRYASPACIVLDGGCRSISSFPENSAVEMAHRSDYWRHTFLGAEQFRTHFSTQVETHMVGRGSNGRVALIEVPAGFKVEQSLERPVWKTSKRPDLAGCSLSSGAALANIPGKPDPFRAVTNSLSKLKTFRTHA